MCLYHDCIISTSHYTHMYIHKGSSFSAASAWVASDWSCMACSIRLHNNFPVNFLWKPSQQCKTCTSIQLHTYFLCCFLSIMPQCITQYIYTMRWAHLLRHGCETSQVGPQTFHSFTITKPKSSDVPWIELVLEEKCEYETMHIHDTWHSNTCPYAWNTGTANSVLFIRLARPLAYVYTYTYNWNCINSIHMYVYIQE